MNRGRVFFVGRKLFITITRGQPGMLSKLERAAGVDGTFLVENSIGGCALRFCRPLSVGSNTLSLNRHMPENKLHGSLADCEGDAEGIERLLQKCSEQQDFSAVLKAFAKSAKAEQALKFLNRMEAVGIDASKSRKAFGMVMRCLCDANMIDDAVKHVKQLQEKGFVPSVKVFNILISAFVRESRLDEALEIVSDMKDIGHRPNVGTHHLLISGYLKLGQMDEAFLQLEEMKLDGCSPTPETLKLFEETHNTTGRGLSGG